MAKNKKKNEQKAEASEPIILEALLSGVKDLWLAHADEILKMQEENEDHKISYAFNVTDDRSDSSPKLKVMLGWTQRTTDSREMQIDDPKQGTFFSVEHRPADPELGEAGDDKVTLKVKRGRKAKADAAPEEEPAHVQTATDEGA